MNLHNGGKELLHQEKIVRYSSHVGFLERCLKEQVVPKGFQMKWRLTTNFYDDINEKCEKVKLDTSFKLMELTLSSCPEKIE